MVGVAPKMHLDMLASVYERSDEFDLVHAHTEWATLPFAEASSTPTLLTLHGRLDIELARRTLRTFPNVALVSLSDHQRRAVRDLPLRWAATIPNGLDLSRYFAEPKTNGGYMAFLGRIAPEKRPDLAVAVASRTGGRLRVAAKVDPLDIDYFTQTVDPLFTRHHTEFLGELNEQDKPAFFAGAEATIFPSDWPEPFGLVMIESLAAGTPVIALRRGSVPEVIVDGVSGFVCDDLDDMVSAVSRLGEINPEDCRRQARRFTAERMSARYCEVMARTIEQAKGTQLSEMA
jgi:glycosyltransferase involved in cell wall biosynthesis